MRRWQWEASMTGTPRSLSTGVIVPAFSGHTSRRLRHTIGSGVAYLVLTVCGLGMAVPFIWLLSTSLKLEGTEFTFPPQWLPRPIRWQNYADALQVVPYLSYARNTLIITVAATAGTLITASLTAFAFARIRFPGRSVLFMLLLSTLMLPDAVTLVPKYILFSRLHWINTYLPLTVPAWFGGGAFNVFLLRQFFMTIPHDLDEAARIDGASNAQVYWNVVLPLAVPALTTVAIFSIMANWNDFLYPLIYLNQQKYFTLALGLQFFQSQYGTQWTLMMAASVMMILPMILLFFFAQRYFIQGIQLTGLAGR
ncbi:MAG: carbohydrate ABC transporter permease [Chloroflexi bacterium]|nr:carbohydrate ABC transporter permease [Chloroflexota bacterium]